MRLAVHSIVAQITSSRDEPFVRVWFVGRWLLPQRNLVSVRSESSKCLTDFESTYDQSCSCSWQHLTRDERLQIESVGRFVKDLGYYCRYFVIICYHHRLTSSFDIVLCLCYHGYCSVLNLRLFGEVFCWRLTGLACDWRLPCFGRLVGRASGNFYLLSLASLHCSYFSGLKHLIKSVTVDSCGIEMAYYRNQRRRSSPCTYGS